MTRTITVVELREDLARLKNIGALVTGSVLSGMASVEYHGRPVLRALQLPGGLWLVRYLGTPDVSWSEEG